MKDNSKAAELVTELKQGWVPVTTLTSHFNWKPHTVRGLLSTLCKKHGLKVERQRIEGITSYRIAE
jgi:predicted transcriptional regulator